MLTERWAHTQYIINDLGGHLLSANPVEPSSGQAGREEEENVKRDCEQARVQRPASQPPDSLPGRDKPWAGFPVTLSDDTPICWLHGLGS